MQLDYLCTASLVCGRLTFLHSTVVDTELNELLLAAVRASMASGVIRCGGNVRDFGRGASAEVGRILDIARRSDRRTAAIELIANIAARPFFRHATADRPGLVLVNSRYSPEPELELGTLLVRLHALLSVYEQLGEIIVPMDQPELPVEIAGLPSRHEWYSSVLDDVISAFVSRFTRKQFDALRTEVFKLLLAAHSEEPDVGQWIGELVDQAESARGESED
jgi:hypothetical protein